MSCKPSKGVRKGGVGDKLPPLQFDIYKIFITCAKEMKCFRILLLVNLSTSCKYHGISLHANFKEHCKWAKK